MKNISSLLAMLALSAMADSSQGSAQEQYETAHREAREGNLSFLMGSWDKLMQDWKHDTFNIEGLTECFMSFGKRDENCITNMDDVGVEMARAAISGEFQACVTHWLEHGAFETVGPPSGESGALEYRLTELGKGIVKGYRMGVKSRGELNFAVIKKLTPEEIKARDNDEADDDRNPLDEIAKMMSKRRRPDHSSSLEELLRMLDGR